MDTHSELPSASGWWLIPLLFYVILGAISVGIEKLGGAFGALIVASLVTGWFIGAIIHMRIRSEEHGRFVSLLDEDKFDKTVTKIGTMIFVLLIFAPDAVPIVFWIGVVWYVANCLLIR